MAMSNVVNIRVDRELAKLMLSDDSLKGVAEKAIDKKAGEFEKRVEKYENLQTQIDRLSNIREINEECPSMNLDIRLSEGPRQKQANADLSPELLDLLNQTSMDVEINNAQIGRILIVKYLDEKLNSGGISNLFDAPLMEELEIQNQKIENQFIAIESKYNEIIDRLFRRQRNSTERIIMEAKDRKFNLFVKSYNQFRKTELYYDLLEVYNPVTYRHLEEVIQKHHETTYPKGSQELLADKD